MYLDYFGLQKKPFGITPDTSTFFAGAERGDILQAILYALKSGEGIVKVVGEVGSGKTMLSRMLANNAPSNTVFVFLINPSIQADQIVYAIAHDLGLNVDKLVEQPIQVLHCLQRGLFELHQAGKRVVLVIDEAQQMPLSTLEEIRLLSNLETETEKLLQIIMFGQPELDQHIDTPSVRQLRERITYEFYLSPLSWEMAASYLAFRLERAGSQGREVFTSSAIKLLSKRSNGTLRRLNVLADKALLAAFLQKSVQVDVKQVKAALNDGKKQLVINSSRYLTASLSGVLLVLLLAWYGFSSLLGDKTTEPYLQLAHSLIEPVPAPLSADLMPKPKVSLLTAKLESFEQWQQQSQAQYTIRLLAAAGDKAGLVETFLRRVQNLGDIAYLQVYRLESKNQDYIVYYGEFLKHSDALKALKNLPLKLKKFGPYISTVPKLSRQ